MADSKIPPKYNVAIVEAVILKMAADLHPQRLTAEELSLKIVWNAADAREVQTAAQAICNLREFGVFKNRDDELVESTPATLHVVALLT